MLYQANKKKITNDEVLWGSKTEGERQWSSRGRWTHRVLLTTRSSPERSAADGDGFPRRKKNDERGASFPENTHSGGGGGFSFYGERRDGDWGGRPRLGRTEVAWECRWHSSRSAGLPEHDAVRTRRGIACPRTQSVCQILLAIKSCVLQICKKDISKKNSLSPII
jgi:hypothetical protein